MRQLAALGVLFFIAATSAQTCLPRPGVCRLLVDGSPQRRPRRTCPVGTTCSQGPVSCTDLLGRTVQSYYCTASTSLTNPFRAPLLRRACLVLDAGGTVVRNNTCNRNLQCCSCTNGPYPFVFSGTTYSVYICQLPDNRGFLPGPQFRSRSRDDRFGNSRSQDDLFRRQRDRLFRVDKSNRFGLPPLPGRNPLAGAVQPPPPGGNPVLNPARPPPPPLDNRDRRLPGFPPLRGQAPPRAARHGR